MELVVIGVAIALKTQVSAGLVGLAVVHVTTLARSLSDLVMQWTEMETSLGAVSRIYRFKRDTPREEKHGEEDTALPEDWPLSGSITFENASATYEYVNLVPVTQFHRLTTLVQADEMRLIWPWTVSLSP
jgi:ABC-type multidrug transport system fused ATPase/permease subunit